MPGNWWETSSGDHIEPLGGGAKAITDWAFGGSNNPYSQWIESHRDLTFGTGERPGILGTGRFQGDYYRPGDTSQVPGYADWQRQLQGGLMNANSRANYQIDPTMQGQVRDRQMTLADQLAAQANGTGTSAAQLQLQRGLDQNMAQIAALAAGQRGQNAGAQMRQVANQQNQLGLQTNQDAAILRAQEQAQAQNTLGQLYAGMRGQDLSLASGNAQLSTQQRAMNDQMTQFYLSQGMDLAKAQQAAAFQMEQLRVNQNLQQQAIQAQAYENARKGNADLLSMVGQGLAMSDERAKTDVKSGDARVDAVLDKLGAHAYRYKEPEKDGEGEHLSVMAQELEETELGKRVVLETPRGKMVDYGKALPFMLAGLARAHRRLKLLERVKGG